ncbi:MAG: response regulator [Anaerolineae bacterium]|nr:response regulator [Anaerolineae bacterium]
MNKLIRVLLIEDNPGDRELIRQMLSMVPDAPFHLETAARLSHGISLLKETPFDLVLLDLSLPDSQGLQTLTRVMEAVPDVPIVVLTGFNDTVVGLQAVQEGAQDYLVKGEVESRLLARAMHYALERHRAEEALRRREEEYRSLIDDVFDNSLVAVFILDRDCKIVWINEATETYFGLQREDVIGQDKRDLVRNHLCQICEDVEAFAESLLTAYDQGLYTDPAICHIRADPGNGLKERWLEHWSQRIRAGLYAGGRIEQYTDITEHKRVEVAEREQRTLTQALSDSIVALTSTLDFEEVLDRILDNARYVVPHDTAKILMIKDGVARVVRTQMHDGTGQHYLDQRLGARLVVEEKPYLREMYETGQPVVIHDIQGDSKWAILPGDDKLHACVAAPICLQSEIIGFINLLSEQPGCLKPIHAERLQAFTAYAAIAIQNAQLFEQSRELAAVEERQRIARDLHDAVSQSLFSASVIAQSLPRLWDTNPDRILAQLQYLDELTQSALSEMRMLLLELRPSALQDVSLGSLLQQLARTLETRKQIRITASIDDLPMLVPEIKVALYRIAQEALNNMAKHSQATQAHVTLRREEDHTALSIHDNGVGFQVGQAAPTSLGMRIMYERAEEIGAHLTITSGSTGTDVTVTWSDEIVSGAAEG